IVLPRRWIAEAFVEHVIAVVVEAVADVGRRGRAGRDRADRAVLRRVAHDVTLPGTRADARGARAAERGELLVNVVVAVVVERVTRFGRGRARRHRALGRSPRRR